MFADVPVLDPILSIAITLYVLFNVYGNIKESLRIILQGSPESVDIDELKKMILAIDGVGDIHDVHLWSVDGEYNVLTVHVVLSSSLQMEKLHGLKTEIREKLLSLGVQHSTIEFEAPDEDCEMGDCS